MTDVDPRPTIVKVGGSLFDVPNLGDRLRRWLDEQRLARTVLVPGGGPMADAVRSFDQWQCLGEKASHWFALRAMSLNAVMLAEIINGSPVADWEGCAHGWRIGRQPILDASLFAIADDERPGHLPHIWAVSSDSVAARAAIVLGARRLVLLKSITLPEGMDWVEAARQGFVDASFAPVLVDAPADLEVRVVNFRAGRT